MYNSSKNDDSIKKNNGIKIYEMNGALATMVLCTLMHVTIENIAIP
ncbi:hypothetical protein [Polluticaenibacter yanchengensis]|uniref:Uncharacterized protein n=1 Tax=Polluticaenibacter yanchengensis TaxID=3014562 RepID=A0ABT4UKM7_9BACT|nr:hypothetical protein [Chitinophagaceae bacterium LY-5]